MSLRRPSLRLAVGLALFVLATTVGPASAAPRPVAATPAPAAFPASSCQGTSACTYAVGPIGENSCNGEYACYGNKGAVGADSCDGDYACYGAFGGGGSGSVGNNSCNGSGACYAAFGDGGSGSIGNNSCSGTNTCFAAFAEPNESGSIGNNSCNGNRACYPISSDVGNCEHNDVQPAACETQPDARIRRVGRTNLVGNDIYNTDATDQTLTATLKPGDKVRFSITIQNDSAVADSFTLRADCLAGLFAPALLPISEPALKFVTGRPGQDITADVRDLSNGYVTRTVEPGGTFRLRAVVKEADPAASLGSAASERFACLITATSVGNPANVDAVKFSVLRQAPN